MTDVVDYLVLSMNTASEANSVYSWQIPKAYYSDQRSSVCKVELIQFNHTKGSHHDIAYVSTNLGLSLMDSFKCSVASLNLPSDT